MKRPGDIPGVKTGRALKEEKEKLESLKQEILSAAEPGLKPEKQKEYRFFDTDTIVSQLSMRYDTGKKAREILRSKKLVLEDVTLYYRDWTSSLSCRWTGRFQGIAAFPFRVELDVNQDTLLWSRCECPECSNKNSYYRYEDYENCEHVVAGGFLLKAYLDSHALGDASDLAGIQMLWELEEKNHGRVETAALLPQLQYTQKEGKVQMRLSFQVGRDKLYQIKNLRAFMEGLEREDEQTFGKGMVLRMGFSSFGAKEKEILDFIRQALEAEEDVLQHLRESYRFRPKKITNSIPLSGFALSAAYRLLKDKDFGLRVDIEGSKARFSHGECREIEGKLAVTIDPFYDRRNVFAGVKVRTHRPGMLFSGEEGYFVQENLFCKCTGEVARVSGGLERALDGRETAVIGRNHLTGFYRRVLPKLQKVAEVQDHAPMVKEYLPQAPDIVYFLDIENNQAVGKLEARYPQGRVDPILDRILSKQGDIQRDRDGEEDAVERLKAYLSDTSQAGALASADEEEIYRLKTEGVEKLLELGTVMASEKFQALRVFRRFSPSVGVSLKSNLLHLELSSGDIPWEELEEILSAYKQKKKYYRLKSGAFVNMEEADLEGFQELVDTLQISGKALRQGALDVPLYRSLYLNEMMQEHEALAAGRDESFLKLIEGFEAVQKQGFQPPKSLEQIMRSYQKEGFAWLRMLEELGFGGILADDMGLGKTLQVISLLVDARERGRLQRALVVCPASLVYNWKEEIEKFDQNRCLHAEVLTGTRSQREALLHQGGDVLIVSYDTLRRDIALYEGMEFSHQILDEAQFIKNHTTAVAKAVKVVRGGMKVALTGTPIENRLSELWSIFDYVMPGFLYQYSVFRSRYENQVVLEEDTKAAEGLRRMISPFVMRRLKSQVAAFLPDKLEEVRVAKFGKEQQKLYDAQLGLLKRELQKDSFESNKFGLLAQITRLRQICCDPALLFENYTGGSAKLETCMDLIGSALEGGHKILLFSQFTSMLGLIRERFMEEGISYYEITGATPKAQRQELVKAFNEDDTSVFLISLKAGGTGLNLVGADIIIHYDPWWNLAAQNQATDRAHRIGQKNVVTVYKLIAKGSIEERIAKLQESKKDLADRILQMEEGLSLAGMTKEELLGLLG